MLSACEGLDDEHRCATVSAHEGGRPGSVCSVMVWESAVHCWGWAVQQRACRIDIVLAPGVSEQAVVTYTVKARRQDVQQKAAHELFGAKCHGLMPGVPVSTVVLPAEAHVAFIHSQEPGVGDRHPMRITR